MEWGNPAVPWRELHRRLTAFYGEGVRLRSGLFGTVVRVEVPA